MLYCLSFKFYSCICFIQIDSHVKRLDEDLTYFAEDLKQGKMTILICILIYFIIYAQILFSWSTYTISMIWQSAILTALFILFKFINEYVQYFGSA